MFGKLVALLLIAAVASAAYTGPPTYGYGSTTTESYKAQQGSFGPVASKSGLKPYSGPTITEIPTPVPGTFTATTKNGNPVSIPSYPAVQYPTKSNAISYSFNIPAAAYPSQYSGVTDYPASYTPQSYAQSFPQAYPQPSPQVQPQIYSYPPQYQGYPSPNQGFPVPAQYQPYPVPPQYQTYSPSNQYQAYPAPPQYQTNPAPTQYQGNPSPVYPPQFPVYIPTQNQAYAPTQYQAYPAPASYPGYPSGIPGVLPNPSVQPSSPVQYSSAPAVSRVRYSGSDGSYSWKK